MTTVSADRQLASSGPSGMASRWAATGAWIKRHPVFTVFLLALAARCVVVAYVAVRYGGYLFQDDLGYIVIASDAANGTTQAWDEYTRGLYHRNATLLYPMTALFWVFGDYAFIGQLYVAAAGALAAALVTRLALELAPPVTAVVVGLWLGLLPSQVLFSSLTLKDALVWAALSGLAVLLAVAGRLRGRALVRPLLGMVVVLVLLRFLREHTLVVALWALALAAWFGNRSGRWQRVPVVLALMVAFPWVTGGGPAGVDVVRGAHSPEVQRSLGAQGAATALVAPAPSSGQPAAAAVEAAAAQQAQAAAAAQEAAASAARAKQIQQQLAAAMAQSEPPVGTPQSAEERARREAERVVAQKRLADLRAQAAQAAAAAQQAQTRAAAEQERAQEAAAAQATAPADRAPDGLDGVFGEEAGSSTARNLAYLPRGLVALVLRPLPWEPIDNPRVRLAQLETVAWYPMLGLALLGLTGLRRHARVLAFPLVVGAGTAAMWALVEGNFGTAYRHRGEFVWAVAALAAYGVCVLSRGLARRRAARTVPPYQSERAQPTETPATAPAS